MKSEERHLTAVGMTAYGKLRICLRQYFCLPRCRVVLYHYDKGVFAYALHSLFYVAFSGEMFLSFVLHSSNNYGVVAASYDGILIHQEVPSEGALHTLSLTFGFFYYALSFTKITCVVVIA